MKPIIFVLGIFLLTWIPSSGRTIWVGGNHSIHSIKEALRESQPGDTIWVDGGTYREQNITIYKPVVLLGKNYPVLDGEVKYEIVSVKSDHVTIKGFKVVRSGISSMEDLAAIKIYRTRDVEISDNILEDNFFGVYSLGGTSCRILNNKIKASSPTEQRSGNGIHCWKSDSLQIIGNTITGHRDGIYFEFTTNSLIWKNVSFHNMRYGLHFMFSHNDTYIANRFRDNSAGVSVMFTHGVKMLDNFFEDNWGDGGDGLLLKEINDSYVTGNHFLSNTSGIYMEGSNRIKIEKNEFIGNGWALKIQASCMDVTVSHNNFQGNTFDVGTNGTLVLNSFDNNYWDKYEGYDLNRDGIGDVPFHPVSLFSVIVEKNPSAMMLFRSFMTSLLDRSERILPSLTPEHLVDNAPYMKPFKL